MREPGIRRVLPKLHSQDAKKLSLNNISRSSCRHPVPHCAVVSREYSKTPTHSIPVLRSHFITVFIMTFQDESNQTVIPDVLIYAFGLLAFIVCLLPAFHEDVANTTRPFVCSFLAILSQVVTGKVSLILSVNALITSCLIYRLIHSNLPRNKFSVLSKFKADVCFAQPADNLHLSAYIR